MTNALRIQAWKELRALLPWWAGTVAAVLACNAISSHSNWDRIGLGLSRKFWFAGLFIYVVGTVALGALSVGHEYMSRTLGGLLAQPVSRVRLLATKLGVLVLLVLVQVLIAFWTIAPDPFGRGEVNGTVRQIFMFYPAIVAVFVAPWLTMVCRGALAGLVFSIAIPAGLLAIGRMALDPQPASLWNLVWQGTVLVAAAGAVMTWRTFLRIEAIDGPQAEIDIPAWLDRQTDDRRETRRRHRLWLLVRKELRLQQMTFVVSAMYTTIWIGVALARRLAVGFGGPDLAGITMLHSLVIPLIAGALASAEERRLAAADWHVLLPIAAWQQWTIKAGLAITLAGVLGIGLPMLFDVISPSPELHGSLNSGLIIPLCVAALYVSSASSSGMRALLALFPVMAGAMLIAFVIVAPIAAFSASGFHPLALVVEPWVGVRNYPRFMDRVGLVLFAGLLLLLLRLGSHNHRSAERGFARLARQSSWIVEYSLGAALVMSFIDAMYWAAYWASRTR